MNADATQRAQVPPTRNTAWGFWGAMGEQAQEAWPLAIHAIAQADGFDRDAIRAFLDSRFGRHFADDVQNALGLGQSLENAIDTATRRWMGWTIDSMTSKQFGIPHGLPYLTGFVIHCEITEQGVEASLSA